LSGAALCGYGIYLRVEEDDYADICEQYSWANAANLCIAAGALIFFIAAFGCIGAAMKSSALLGFVSTSSELALIRCSIPSAGTKEAKHI
jgi:hypothetical protein